LHASHYESLARTDRITSGSPTSLGARLFSASDFPFNIGAFCK